METTFLSNVVKSVIDFPLRETIIVFPTRRACLAFRTEISKELKKTAWLPTIQPVRELLPQLCSLPVANDITLLMELFKVYSELTNNEQTIDSFLNLGQQILDDFNEIDRQMVPVEHLFKSVIDIKNLESAFQFDEEELLKIQEFWSQFTKENISPLRTEFLGYWEMLPVLYTAYKKHLTALGISYEGMAWRLAASEIKNNAYFKGFSKIVFAGFYALTKTEEVIFNSLIKENKLVLFRDADPWYVANRYQEAGKFFRKGLLSNPEIPWSLSHLAINHKEINITGVAGKAAMAREIAISVNKFFSGKPPSSLANSVVVLPDDSLLFPFLNHCAQLGIAVNPSMGFPLSHHPLFQLLHAIRIIRKQLADNPGIWFINEHSKWLQQHPLVLPCLTEDEIIQLKAIADGEKVSGGISPVAAILTTFPDKPETEKIIVFNFIKKLSENNVVSIPGLMESVIHEAELISLQLSKYTTDLNNSSWWSLFLVSLEKIRIPFKGNNDLGIHVMGFLETRIIDYENVFIASMNEGVLPGNSTPKSIIPHSLRKAYQLPCSEEQEAVTAYHFYRLLQRASVIQLFYNSDMNDLGGGERSRFLFQLHHEISKVNPNAKFHYTQIENTPTVAQKQEIVIFKNNAIIEALQKKFVEGFVDKDSNGLSASVINSYIACSLRFYFEQIAYLQEDIPAESIDPKVFGNILHHTMYLLYKDHKKIDANVIETSMTQVEEMVQESINFKYNSFPLVGNDFLMNGVLIELINKILKFDLSESPLEIIALEEKLRKKIKIEGVGNVLLKGTLDRIDDKNGVIRIIDYKTGKDDLKLPDEIVDIFRDPLYKTSLQLLLYVFLYNDQLNNRPIIAGLIRIRQLSSGILFLNQGEPLHSAMLNEFEKCLQKIIGELFNSEIPFMQTQEIERCRNCDFKGICNRLT